MNNNAKIVCSLCDIPIVFNDIQRTNKQTFGIYMCPKCSRRFRI